MPVYGLFELLPDLNTITANDEYTCRARENLPLHFKRNYPKNERFWQIYIIFEIYIVKYH